jgi:hypothetical protein
MGAFMKGSYRRGLAALFLVVIVAPACGGSDDGSKSSGAAKQDFIKKAGAVCDSSSEVFNALFDTDFPTIRSQTPAFFTKALPVLEERNSNLKDLKVPEGDEDEISSMLDSGDKTVADFKKATGDEEFAGELFSGEGGANSVAFEKKAGDYGIKECATDEGGGEPPVTKVDISGFSAEKKAYIETADAICKAAAEKAKPIEDEVFAQFPPTAQAWKTGLPKLLEIQKPAFEEFESVKPPVADKAAIDAINQKADILFASLDEANQAAAAGDEEKLGVALQKAFPLFDEVDQDRREFGFQVCGSEGEDEEEGGEG